MATAIEGAGLIEVRMRLPYRIEKEEGLYVSSCPILDIVSQGETQEEALANLIEATTLFIKTCFGMGTLEQVLTDCGFMPTEATQPAILREQADMIEVPLPMLIARKHVQDHAH